MLVVEDKAIAYRDVMIVNSSFPFLISLSLEVPPSIISFWCCKDFVVGFYFFIILVRVIIYNKALYLFYPFVVIFVLTKATDLGQ